MSITLPPDLERFVNEELLNGCYQSEDELLCDGVRLLRERRLHGLRVAVQRGLEQIEHGEGIVLADDELDSFFDSLEAEVVGELAAETKGV